MLPSLPLDGGRIFRSIIWQLTGNYQRSTHWSEGVSSVLAFGFFGLGAFIAFRGRLFDGIWMIFIGWFLQNSIASNREQSTLNRSLSQVSVENIMSQEFNQVSEGTSIARVIDTLLTEEWIPVVFVLSRGHLKGMLLMHDLASLPRSRWEGTTVEQVMVPLEPQVQLGPNSTLMAAMLAMDQFQLATLPVVSNGYPTGLISRDQVLEYIRYRTDTGM
jgi:predicted transcriptional regulator